jgi:hypothetical protein
MTEKKKKELELGVAKIQSKNATRMQLRRITRMQPRRTTRM